MSKWTRLQAEIRDRLGVLDEPPVDLWRHQMGFRWTGWVEMACHHRAYFHGAERMPQIGDSWFCDTDGRSYEIVKTTGRGQ